jgi:hypothetical protein
MGTLLFPGRVENNRSRCRFSTLDEQTEIERDARGHWAYGREIATAQEDDEDGGQRAHRPALSRRETLMSCYEQNR